MVALEVHTGSPEVIKPSSPTPDHLRSFELCALDQLVDGTVYSPVWYFYPSTRDHHMSMSMEGRLDTLKYSLSKTLTRFYPLAGRVNSDSTTIDCNDEGAVFRQAKVSCDMDDFLDHVSSEFESLYKLLPCQLTCPGGVEKEPQVAIQANVFACGGIALGTCLLYRIVDGTTFTAFIRAWAEIARTNISNFGGQEQVSGCSSLFPPNESLSTPLADLQVVMPSMADEAKRKTAIKRFSFDSSAISSLKSKARSENVPNPTRVEAICALFWKCLATGTASTSVFINFVNIRARLNPPLPALSVGNIYWLAIAIDDQIINERNKKQLPYFVNILRKSIKRVDSEYLKNFQGEQGLERIRKFHEDAKELYSKSGLTLEVSAINRMGSYDADFGWGEPSWVTSAPSYKNEMLLIETKSGDGVEASLMLDDRQVAILEHDPEFRAHARPSQLIALQLKTMEVEIESTECIRPSPSTHHLKTHKISLLDQLIPNEYFPLILFYPPNQASISETSQVLKQSLSQILALYYPLAGKANDDLSIDCNDEGARYVNARINCNLCDYLKHPTISAFPKFLPGEIVYGEITPGAHVLMIQETLFSCGGIAIGVVASHKIFDGAALCAFMRNWATVARGSIEGAVSPDFTASSIFPQNNRFPEDLTTSSLATLLFSNGTSVTRRFVFDGSVLSILKAKAASSTVPNPTRVEVATAFIFKCMMSALKVKSGTQKSALVANLVNMRRRAVPQFPETFLGSFLMISTMISESVEGEGIELCDFVRQMRESVLAINGDLVKSFEGDEGLGNLCEAMKEIRELSLRTISEGMVLVMINSWCNLGLYEVDYGWGKPLWIPFAGMAQAVPERAISLMDSRDDKGVEAWVTLDEQAMLLLEHDEELLSLASVNPSAL